MGLEGLRVTQGQEIIFRVLLENATFLQNIVLRERYILLTSTYAQSPREKMYPDTQACK